MIYSKVINDTLFDMVTFHKRISIFTFHDEAISFDGCFEKLLFFILPRKIMMFEKITDFGF